MTTMIDKINAAFERDKTSGFVAKTADQLPLSFESITDEWLTAILCGNAPGAAVTSHNLSEKDNGSSNRRKIYLTYNAAGEAAGLPKALFCKATHDLANRIVLGVSGGALGEVTFYNRIRPLLDIEAPVSVFANYDPESANSIIVMHDISDDVMEFCNHNTVMTKERARSQMRVLGRLHGKCYSDPELAKRIHEIVTFKEFWEKSLAFGFEDGCIRGFKEGKDVIPPRLFAREAEIWPATEDSVRELDSLPNTLAHCDVHLKNWYVAGNGEMALSDWQCCGRAHWGRDLAYTIGTALKVEDRRAWEKELVAYYLEQLAENGGPKVSFEEGFRHYRRQFLGALAYWTITLCPSPSIPDMQPRDITLEFIRRITTAMDDLDTLDAVA
jgi:hypothetical protein